MAQNQQAIAGGGEKYPRYRWVIIGLLILTQEISILLTGAVGMLLPAMRADLGFGIAESGVLGSLAQLPMVIFSIPAGLLLIRYSPKWVYFVSLVLSTISAFFCGRSPVFIILALTYFLMGAAVVIRNVPDTLLRFQWIPRKEFASVMGITLGLSAVGQTVSVMIVPFLLIALGGWRNLFSVYSLGILLLSIMWIVFARHRITPAYQEEISSMAGRSTLRGVFKHKEFILLAIAAFGGGSAYMSTLLFLPTYLLEERGITLTTIGLIVGLMPIGGVCGGFSMGFISDRIGLRKPTIWPAGIILPFLYFALLSPVPAWALPVLTFVLGYMAWAPFPAIRTIPFELPGIKPSEVAVGQCLIQTVNTLGIVISAPVVGYLAKTLGSLGTALYVVCLFPLTLAIIGFLLPETGTRARHKKRERGALESL